MQCKMREIAPVFIVLMKAANHDFNLLIWYKLEVNC